MTRRDLRQAFVRLEPELKKKRAPGRWHRLFQAVDGLVGWPSVGVGKVDGGQEGGSSKRDVRDMTTHRSLWQT